MLCVEHSNGGENTPVCLIAPCVRYQAGTPCLVVARNRFRKIVFGVEPTQKIDTGNKQTFVKRGLESCASNRGFQHVFGVCVVFHLSFAPIGNARRARMRC